MCWPCGGCFAKRSESAAGSDEKGVCRAGVLLCERLPASASGSLAASPLGWRRRVVQKTLTLSRMAQKRPSCAAPRGGGPAPRRRAAAALPRRCAHMRFWRLFGLVVLSWCCRCVVERARAHAHWRCAGGALAVFGASAGPKLHAEHARAHARWHLQWCSRRYFYSYLYLCWCLSGSG